MSDALPLEQHGGRAPSDNSARCWPVPIAVPCSAGKQRAEKAVENGTAIGDAPSAATTRDIAVDIMVSTMISAGALPQS